MEVLDDTDDHDDDKMIEVRRTDGSLKTPSLPILSSRWKMFDIDRTKRNP